MFNRKLLPIVLIFLVCFTVVTATATPFLMQKDSPLNNYSSDGSISSLTITNTIKPINNSFAMGVKPIKIFFDQDNNYVYVLSKFNKSMYVFNSGSTVIGNTIPLKYSSSQFVYDFFDKCIYVSNDFGNEIAIIDTTTNSLVGYLNTGNYTEDKGLFFNSYNHLLYVESLSQNDLVVLNVTTHNIENVIPIKQPFTNGAISMDLHNNLYIPNKDNSTTIINSETNLVSNVLLLNGAPLTTTYDQWTGFIYITDSNDQLVVYDPISNQIVKTISVESFPVDVLYDKADDAIFELNNNTGTLEIINGFTNTVEGQMIVGSDPISLTYDTNNNMLYIVQNKDNSVYQVSVASLIQMTITSSSKTTSINGILTESFLIAILICILLVIGSLYLYVKGKDTKTFDPELSVDNLEDIFKKKVLMQYIYGRLTVIFEKFSKLPDNFDGKTYLINNEVNQADTSVSNNHLTRLGIHGQNLMKDINGLSLLILLEFADSFPHSLTLTAVSKTLNKPKSTIKSQMDRLILLEYISDPKIYDYSDHRYRNLMLTTNGREFLKLVKQEIELSGILIKKN